MVACNPVISMLKLESPSSARLAEAIKAPVEVITLRNAIREPKLTWEDRVRALSSVPAGVIELMAQQSEG